RRARAARVSRAPVGPSGRRAADPNLTPSSQNRTRTPLAGAARGANSSFKRPDMRLFLSIRRKVEAGFAGAIKLAPIARTYLRVLAQDVKRARFPRPARTRKGLRHPLGGRGRAWLKPFQAPRPRPTALRAYEDLPRRRLWPPRHTIQINVLLCILKGFALAKPLCCRIK